MQNKFRNHILDADICCYFNKGSRITSPRLLSKHDDTQRMSQFMTRNCTLACSLAGRGKYLLSWTPITGNAYHFCVTKRHMAHPDMLYSCLELWSRKDKHKRELAYEEQHVVQTM